MKKLIPIIARSAAAIILLTSCSTKTESGFADINGTQLYYEITGKGTPLVFLHGFTCDHRNWNPQVEYFASKYRVITYDARGHGQSSVPDSMPYSYEEDLSNLMDYLNIDQAILVGHSMGGAPAFFYTLNKPDRVLGLVLAEGGAFLSDPAIVDTSEIPDFINEFVKVYTIVQNDGIEKGKEAFLNIQPVKSAAQNPASSELLRTMLKDYSGWHWLHEDPQKNNPEGTIEMMESIHVPSLIIAGEFSHPVLKDLVSAQAKYIPNAKLALIKNANHMVNIENPDQFNRELELFLGMNDIE